MPPTTRSRRWEHELICLHCGRHVDEVTVSDPRVPLLVPRDLQCGACGGRPIPSGFVRQSYAAEPLPPIPPRRRGRPPRWLLELRRRRRAESPRL